MNKPDPRWQKLVAAARRAPAPGDESAPFGFSTRVAARAFEPSANGSLSFARLSFRVAAVALVLAGVSVGVNYSAIAGAFEDVPPAAAAGADDPVADIVSLGS